jgi:hypothetical protein
MKGAVDVAQDADCQLNRNTVRNQFSPVYQKTLQPARIKERAVHLAQLADRVQGEVSEYQHLVAPLRDMLKDIVKRHEELNSATSSLVIDAVRSADGGLPASRGRMERAASLNTQQGAAANISSARTPQGTSLEFPELLVSDRDDDDEGSCRGPMNRSRSAVSLKLKNAVAMVRQMSERRTSTGSSSAASLKKLTRANSNALELESDLNFLLHRRTNSPSSRGPSTALSGHVLVHVLTPGHLPVASCITVSSSAGNIVAGTLRASPTGGVQLTTVVTTEASSVSAVMKAQLPTSVVLVVPPVVAAHHTGGDVAKEFVTSAADAELLFRLDRTSGSRKTSNGQRMQCFILLPEDLRRHFMLKKFSVRPPAADFSAASTRKDEQAKQTKRASAVPSTASTPENVVQASKRPLPSFSRSLEDFADFHTVLYYDTLAGLEEVVRRDLSGRLYEQASGSSSAATSRQQSVLDRPPPNEGAFALDETREFRPNEVYSACPSPQPAAGVSSARVPRRSPRRGASSPLPRRIMSPQPLPTVVTKGTLPPIGRDLAQQMKPDKKKKT